MNLNCLDANPEHTFNPSLLRLCLYPHLHLIKDRIWEMNWPSYKKRNVCLSFVDTLLALLDQGDDSIFQEGEAMKSLSFMLGKYYCSIDNGNDEELFPPVIDICDEVETRVTICGVSGSRYMAEVFYGEESRSFFYRFE